MSSSWSTCRAVVLVFVLRFNTVRAANWAQTTGSQKQNVVVSAKPGQGKPHWSGREGMAVAVFNATAEGTSASSRLYLIGGDDGGGFRNDIWFTGFVTWHVGKDDTDYYRTAGAPMVRSGMHWEPVQMGRAPPTDVTHREWVQCSTALLGSAPIGVRHGPFATAAFTVDCSFVESQKTVLGASSSGQQPSLWVNDAMFSPRRYHQAAFFGNVLWVLGGEAREAIPTAASGTYDGVHQQVLLKNDVWFSVDGGAHWTLSNAGCDSEVTQEELIPTWAETRPGYAVRREANPDTRDGGDGGLELGGQQRVTSAQGECTADKDCYGDSFCFAKQTTEPLQQNDALHGICTCRIWSPRKLHRVAIVGDAMFLVGGFSETLQGMCGRLHASDPRLPSACGQHQRVAMNDVWRADLGHQETWTNLRWTQVKAFSSTSVPESWSGRGNFGLAFMKLYGEAAMWAMTRLKATNPAAGIPAETSSAIDGVGCLWITGGEGSPDEFFGETWLTVVDELFVGTGGADWIQFTQIHDEHEGGESGQTASSWSARAGHVVTVEPASVENNGVERMVIHGGFNSQGLVPDETWSWGPECRAYGGNNLCTAREMASAWVDDYSPGAWYKLRTNIRDVNCLIYSNGTPPEYCWKHSSLFADAVWGPPTPFQHYVDALSLLGRLTTRSLPGTFMDKTEPPPRRDINGHGVTGPIAALLTPSELGQLAAVGILTVNDLASASASQLARLRGFGDGAMAFHDVCDYYVICQAIVNKCSVDPAIAYGDAFQSSPERVPVKWHSGFRGSGHPQTQPGDTFVASTSDLSRHPTKHRHTAHWSGRDFTGLEGQTPYEDLPAASAAAKFEQGVCTLTPPGETTFLDVAGIGMVSLLEQIKDPREVVDELICKWHPRPRRNHGGAWFQGSFYVVGGRDELGGYAQDTWYRDDQLPSTTIVHEPVSETSDALFKVASNEPGVVHEHLLYDNTALAVATGWTKVPGNIVSLVDWLIGNNPLWSQQDTASKYTIYVRSVDPAGNVDPTFFTKKWATGRNQVTWKFHPPAPVLRVCAITGTALLAMILIHVEVMRQRRAEALRIYAIKRLRRKMKKLEEGAKKYPGWYPMVHGKSRENNKDKNNSKEPKEARHGKVTPNKAEKGAHKGNKDVKNKEKEKKEKDKACKKPKTSRSNFLRGRHAAVTPVDLAHDSNTADDGGDRKKERKHKMKENSRSRSNRKTRNLKRPPKKKSKSQKKKKRA